MFPLELVRSGGYMDVHDSTVESEMKTEIPCAFFTVEGACEYSGLSRTRIYQALATRDLTARKAGRRTLIARESLDALMAALPPATFKPAKAAA